MPTFSPNGVRMLSDAEVEAMQRLCLQGAADIQAAIDRLPCQAAIAAERHAMSALIGAPIIAHIEARQRAVWEREGEL